MPANTRIYQVTRNDGTINSYSVEGNSSYDSAVSVMQWANTPDLSEPKDASLILFGDGSVYFHGQCDQFLPLPGCKVYKVQYFDGNSALKTFVVAGDFGRLRQWAQGQGFTILGGIPLPGTYKNSPN